MASSQEREKILARLFDTSVYRRIEENLKSRTSSLVGEIDRLKTTVQARLGHFNCDDVQQLGEIGEGLASDIKKATRKLKKLKKREKKTLGALAEALDVEKKFNIAESRQEQLKELLAQNSKFNQDRERYKAGQRAARLADIHAQFKDEQDQAKQARDSRDEAGRAQQRSKSEFEAAKARLAAGEECTPKIEEFKARLVGLSDYSQKLKGLDNSRAEFVRATEKVDNTGALLKEKTTDKARLADRLAVVSAQLEALAGRQVDESLLTLKITRMKDEIRNRREIARVQDEQQKVSDELSIVEKAFAELEIGLKGHLLQLKELRNRRAIGQAVVLARKLQPGEPCPVCGSPDHPVPACGDEEIPDEAHIETAERTAKSHERQRHEMDGQRQGLLQKSGRLDERVSAHQSALQDHADRSLGAAEDELRSAKDTFAQQQSIRDELKHLDELSRSRQQQMVTLQTEYDELAARLGQENLELEAARTRLNDREQSIPKQFHQGEALTGEIEKSESEVIRLENLRKTARAEYADSQIRLAEARSRLENMEALQLKTERRAIKSAQSWEKRLASEGFADESEYREASLDQQVMTDLKTGIDKFDSSYMQARGLAESSAAEISGLQRSDIENLAKVADEASTNRDVKQNKLATLGNEQAHVSQALDDLRQIGHDLDTKQKEYGVVCGLSTLANGPYNKMSFQRFVLAALLDDVLRQSSERLHTMSRGRYRLSRARYQSEQLSSGGLDLEVEDSFTGLFRPVSTLSGGESFQAALALALGLSDVVQAYAGGVQLDTIFIDEGFGSLDEEALDLAINTLIDLQERGRLVGVISHVSEMKERIDAQLVVSSSDCGAFAEFRLP